METTDTCTHNRIGNELRIKITGDFDLVAVPVYRDGIIAEIGTATLDAIAFDLTETIFIDSAGLALIIELYKTKRADICVMVLKGSQAARAFDLTRLTSIVRVEVLDRPKSD